MPTPEIALTRYIDGWFYPEWPLDPEVNRWHFEFERPHHANA